MVVKADTERVVTYVHKDIKAALEQIAKERKRSVSNYLALLIEQEVQKHSKN